MSDVFKLLDSVVDDEPKEIKSATSKQNVNNVIIDSTDELNKLDSPDEPQHQFTEPKNELINREHLKQVKSFNIMVEYIKQHHEDIPEQFRGTVLFDNENNLSLATYWVYIMKTEPVPMWMRHDPNIVDKHHWTIAMHYISVNQELPPEWMQHDPTIQNANGRTSAMLALIYRTSDHENEDLPDWMHHDVNLFDSLGYSVVDYWLSTNGDMLPSWMLSQIDDPKHWHNGLNETIGISYMFRHYQLPPPEFALSDDEAETWTTKHGNTYKAIEKGLQNILNRDSSKK